MTNQEIVGIMKVKVEEIVRNKVHDDFNESKPIDRKGISKAIITELEQVMSDEN